MSQSNAAAIKRRVNVPATQNANQNIGQQASKIPGQPNVVQPTPQTGFTLPQAIALIDSRLATLEKFMREGERPQQSSNQMPIDPNQYVSVSDFSGIIDEFNNRFTMFADEITEMKDILLKLQSYTMEVNKTLMEERIQVFSDLNTNVNNDETNANSVDNATDNESATESTSLDLKNLIQAEFSQPSN
jgi:hypothetical protein